MPSTRTLALIVAALAFTVLPPILTLLLVVIGFTGYTMYVYVAFQTFAPQINLDLWEAFKVTMDDFVDFVLNR